MNAVTERPLNAMAVQEPTPAATPPPRTKANVKKAFTALQAALDDAINTDEVHQWSGDSDRLLLIANSLACGACLHPENIHDAEGKGFDIAALIRAARLVPGDTESEARRRHLATATHELQWLTKVPHPRITDPHAARPQAPRLSFDAQRDFMEGKALAALMAREGLERAPMAGGNVNASYREPGEPQSNFTLPFFELLQREPHLLAGFSAGMSSLLAEADLSGDIVEATAEISYSACTVHRDAEAYETFSAYTEPPLDDQLAVFGLEDFVTIVAPPAPQVAPGGAQPISKGRKASASEHRAPMPTHAPQAVDQHEKPAQLASGSIATMQGQLLVVSSLLELLIFNLDDEMGQGPRGSGDVMGILQHTDLLLYELHEEISNIVGVLPDDLCSRAFEAKAIVAVVQRMTFGTGWALKGYDSTMLIACFEEADNCIKRALRALETVEVRNA